MRRRWPLAASQQAFNRFRAAKVLAYARKGATPLQMTEATTDKTTDSITVPDILDRCEATDTGLILDEAPGWLQGRTLYGGITALLAHQAARLRYPDLPPLRAAQICFIGPVARNIAVEAEALRSGRNVTQVATRLTGEGKLAGNATLVFGNAMEANAVNTPKPEPIATAPEDAEPIALDSGHVPDFVRRMENRKWPMGRENIAVRRWVRLNEREGLDPVSELIALGDALPPGSLKAMQRPGPLSSINWSFNILDADIGTRDGWFLVETASQHAAEGYTTERLRMWNADGVPVMSGMQSVAIFG